MAILASVRKMGTEKAVASAIRRATGTQNFIQQVALLCLETTLTSGNWTPTADLITGISKNRGVKSSKLQQFFEAMMQATFAYDSEKKAWGFTYDDDKSAKDINMEMAEAINWFDFKTPPTDNTKELDAIIKQLTKALDASVETNKVSIDERNELVNACNALTIHRAELLAA